MCPDTTISEKRRFQLHAEGSASGDCLLERWLDPHFSTPTALLVASAVLPKDESVDTAVALLLDIGGVGCFKGLAPCSSAE